MYAETSEKKMSHARVAFALMCGLAVCCSVMYITADGSDMYVHEVLAIDENTDAGTSVGSTDVLKAGQIYTETPDGRMRLMDYFNNVEQEISDEVANRKSDIAAVRAQMARDFAFNAAARATLKKQMLHQMAVNAKTAHDDLNREMRRTQRHFAQNARLANKRQAATDTRNAETARIIASDKKKAARQLKLSTKAWQAATSAWASATNAKIDKMNVHVAANAAQIDENAKKARKDLEHTMQKWDHQVHSFAEDSANARSKLSAQFQQQDKATRAWASNKIKGLVAGTSAQFNDVQTKMSKNRHEIDMALRQASARFAASLNAAKALENKRFQENVANIEGAKAEAKAKVEAATSEFKVSLLTLSSTVKEQVQKVNTAIDETAGVVRSNAAAQAKVNANVNAEMNRMVKLGNDNYKKHLKDDAMLQNAIGDAKEDTDRQMNEMAAEFNEALNKIKGELKKARAHAEGQLESQTSGVWAALNKNRALQANKNAEMKAATRRMKLDALDSIRKAKADFRKKISDLGQVVATNDKKANKQIADLTGVQAENAAKSLKGREEIAALEKANKDELHSAIRDAIDQGEKRAQAVEAKGEKMDADTKWLINNNLKTEISKLREETNAGVEALQLLGKEERLAMKKEMLYAVRSAAEVAETDLQIAVRDGVEKMAHFQARADKSAKASAADRAAIQQEVEDNSAAVTREINAAVATDAAAQATLGQQTAAKIKETNNQIDAYAVQMGEIADKTRADIAAMTATTIEQIDSEATRARDATDAFASADATRQKEAEEFLASALKEAAAASEKKFGLAYAQLAADRKTADDALGSATTALNDALAKQAALADTRFRDTVDDIELARKEAADQVRNYRALYASAIAETTSSIKLVETKLNGMVMKVTGEVATMKSRQYGINRHVEAEINRIEKLSNDRFTENKNARGALRQVMDENKQAAAAEVGALRATLETEVAKMRASNAAAKIEMAKDLTDATETFYEALAKQVKDHSDATEATNDATVAATDISNNNLDRANKAFASKITQLTNTVTNNAKHAKESIDHLTGVVTDYASEAATDRELIRSETTIMHQDLNKALTRAIDEGEAKAKAVEQRIAMHLKKSTRFLQVELVNQCEEAADSVLRIVEEKRGEIANNYLSLKAYAASAVDEIAVYLENGTGLNSIGTLLEGIGAMETVPPVPTTGLGDGATSIPNIFGGDTIPVAGSVAAINGLVNEYTDQIGNTRQMHPMGLGKYLLDKLEESMMDKGVLMVDKVEGKHGNFVYINGHSVGLSNKLNDFSQLASNMNVYEAVLAKLTATITASPITNPEKDVNPVPPGTPEWPGN